MRASQPGVITVEMVRGADGDAIVAGLSPPRERNRTW